MFALNFAGWKSNLAPILTCVAGLVVSLFLNDGRLADLNKGRRRFCKTSLMYGLACLGLGAVIYLALEVMPWSTSFNPPVWMMLVMSAPPLLIGSWDFVGSIFGWDMYTKTFRFFYRLMLLHLVVVLIIPLI